MDRTEAGRLLTLAYFLKTRVQIRHFDMRSYWNESKIDDWYPIPPDLNKPSCGTSACALGWATVVFPDVFVLSQNFGVIAKGKQQICECTREFFGITSDEENHIFYVCSEGRTPLQESRVIEAVVKSNGWVYADKRMACASSRTVKVA